MIEEVIIIVAVLGSLSYLIWKWGFQKKGKSCGGGCGCEGRTEKTDK